MVLHSRTGLIVSMNKMKRFTETDKWRDAWFSELTTGQKLFWLWAWDNCDCAGVFSYSCKIIEVFIGQQMTEIELAAFAGDRIRKLKGDEAKYIIRDFVRFQYGNAYNPSNKVHNSVVNKLLDAGYTFDEACLFFGRNPSLAPSLGAGVAPTPKDKEKDTDTDKDKPSIGEKKERPRNLPMDALVEVCKIEPRAIGANEGKVLRTIKSMCAGDSEEEIARQIRLRAGKYRIVFPECILTANALAKHWGQLSNVNSEVRYNV